MKEKSQNKEIILNEDTKESYSFSYELSYDEAYEAFSLVAFKRSKTFSAVVGLLLTVIAGGCLIAFALDNIKVHLLFIAMISILLLFYLIYMPMLKARRGARSVEKSRGTYKVQLRDIGTISLPGAEPLDLAGDKDARAIETDRVFVVRPDNAHTFCLPKRIMKDAEILGVRDILSAYMNYSNV